MNLYEKSKKPEEFFLITQYLTRRLAYPLALLFRRLGFTANAVTMLGGVSWMISLFTMLGAGRCFQLGHTGAAWGLVLASTLLWNAGYLLDVADGSLARMTGTSSASGYFLDFSFHLLFNTTYLCSLGGFLYMITLAPLYLVMAVLSPCCNWGLSFSAKEHVLCEDVAKGNYRSGDLPRAEEYEVFIDSVKTKTPVEKKRGSLAVFARVVEELACFPGQFTFFSVVLAADFLARPWLGERFLLLRCAFVLVTGIMLLRVPFRLRREFNTMCQYDKRAGPRRG